MQNELRKKFLGKAVYLGFAISVPCVVTYSRAVEQTHLLLLKAFSIHTNLNMIMYKVQPLRTTMLMNVTKIVSNKSRVILLRNAGKMMECINAV